MRIKFSTQQVSGGAIYMRGLTTDSQTMKMYHPSGSAAVLSSCQLGRWQRPHQQSAD